MPPPPVADSYSHIVKLVGHPTAALILALVYATISGPRREVVLAEIADLMKGVIN